MKNPVKKVGNKLHAEKTNRKKKMEGLRSNAPRQGAITLTLSRDSAGCNYTLDHFLSVMITMYCTGSPLNKFPAQI